MKNHYVLKSTLLWFVLLAFSVLSAEVPRTLYSMNGSAETLSKMNLETNTITQNVITTGQTPNQVVSHNGLLYVVNSGTDNISVIDPQTDKLVKTIQLQTSSNPWAMAFVASQKAYVTNFMGNSVSVVDVESGTILKDIGVGIAPEGILVSGTQAFVTNTGYASGSGLASVSIIDLNTDAVTHTLQVPTNAQDLALDPYGRIHVVCTGDYATEFGKIAIIDLYTGEYYDTPAVVDTIEIGGTPGDIVITSAGKGYCVAWGDGTNGFLYEYDALADTVIHDASDPILIGPNVSQLLYDNQEDVLWIPYMTVWGGDGFAQKFDVTSNTITYTSGVLGNGVQALAIVEEISASDPWADEVVSFTAGTNAGYGQNYLPENVLGPPDPSTSVNAYSPSSSPAEILSLGHGGEIILAFTDNQIVNSSGVDFTVFENAFISWDGSVFMELAFVSVSQDGETWYQFPYDTTDFSGFAGATPIGDNQNPTDPSVSGGDQFDLEDVGLAWAKYVKLTDIGDYYQEGTYNGDFDLDAVVAVNSEVTAINESNDETVHNFQLAQNYPNPFNPSTTISYNIPLRRGDRGGFSHVELSVYNLLGQKIRTLVNTRQSAGTYSIQFNAQGLAAGVYFYTLRTGQFSATRKMVLIQ